MKKAAIAISILLFSTFAYAEVKDAAAGGFTTVNEVVVGAARSRAWRAATLEVDQWWSSDHTVSGEASRLSISAKPQGCFCEDLGEDAGVVHMTAGITVYPRLPMALFDQPMRGGARGVKRITRHPSFAGVALFALAHALLATRLVGAVYMAGFAVLAGRSKSMPR